LAGILCFQAIGKLYTNKNIRMKKNRYDRFKDFVKQRLYEKEIDKMLNHSGIKITAAQYQLVRYTVFFVWTSMYILTSAIHRISLKDTKLFTILILFILTTPKATFLGRKTPFKIVIDILTEDYKNRMNLEIYRAISQLKNLAITKEDNPPGADFIIDQLRKFTKLTRPFFNNMMYLWSIGKREEACNYFKTAIGTKEAGDLADIFLKLEYLGPMELQNQMILYQQDIKKRRETEKIKHNENVSWIVYSVVSITVILMLLNFVVVVYYIDSMELMKNILGGV